MSINGMMQTVEEKIEDAAIEHTREQESLRILFYLFFPGSGIGRYTHELVSHLQQREGVEPELACLPGYHWLDEATYPVWPGLREIAHKWPIRRKARFLIAQLANPRRLCRRAVESRTDVIHFSNINHLTYPWWKQAVAQTGAKIAVTVHDVRRAKGIIHHGFETRQLKEFYRNADALFVHSRSQASDLIEFADVAEDRVHVVPHGPYHYGSPTAAEDSLRKKYQLPEDKRVALFFGNIRDEKNLSLLVNVLPRFRDELHLLVAGRGSGGGHQGMQHYQELTEQLKLRDSVTFLDRYISDDEIPDLFTLSDWVALPYKSSFTSQSGVLNVAAAYDRPVLVSPAPTFVETMADCDIGVTMSDESESALINAIESLHSRLNQRHPHQFEEYRQLYGWEENVRRTLDVYRSIVGRDAAAK